MQWEDLLGHEQPKTWFRTALANRRLATSFLFVGPSGIGKRTFAKLLAKSLLCRRTDANALEHCGRCEDCLQVDASTHPDLIEVSKPADKAFIPVEMLIGEREKRMREGLCHDISLRPYGGRRKIAILDDADSLNVEGANCLLKTLEEPPVDSLLILIGTSLQRQLPTIRSRCQSILFRPLETQQVAQLVHSVQSDERDSDGDSEGVLHGLSDTQLAELVDRSGGSLCKIRLLSDPTLRDFASHLQSTLGAHQIPLSEFAKEVTAVVEAAGKDNRIKRDRMKVLFEMAADFYRAQAISDDLSVRKSATQCWNRCLTAIEQVDRNANQAGLIEAWTADVAALSGR